MTHTSQLLRTTSLACLFLYVLLAGHRAAAQDVFTSSSLQNAIQTAVGCDLSARLKADLTVAPLYQLGEAGCESVVPASSGTYYQDAACASAIDFSATGQRLFCEQVTDSAALGEGGSEATGTWTLSPGSTYEISPLSLDARQQPYRTSEVYRSVGTAAGECQLLMRVYRKDLRSDASQPALIALHGGSWRNRGFGAFGLEAVATYYADRGFVVFAPFYRLLGNSDGSAACQGATLPQIVDDITAALSWVEQNSNRYSAAGTPVLFGQSAGAHLALTLAVNYPQRIAAAVLLYPPTDFTDLLTQLQAGEYTNQQGIGTMNVLLGDAQSYDLGASPVPENSFPQLIVAQSQELPPMKIVHGLADELVPAQQSVRLCNALAGRDLSESVETQGRQQTTVSCGGDSELTLFAQGDHALDVCVAPDPLLTALVGELCLSGDAAASQLVAEELDRTITWAVSKTRNATSTGGGGMMLPFWLLLLNICAFWKQRRFS